MQRSPAMIVNRRLSLPERGKIKIGGKGAERPKQGGGTFQIPVKYDHFVITTMERGKDGNFAPDLELMAVIAERTEQKADHLTRLPIRLLYDDMALSFMSRYAAYEGRALWCSGNGRVAARREMTTLFKERECPCEHLERGWTDKPCKINGALSVLIDGAPGVGGVWKFRTTSFNSVDNIVGSLSFIKSVTGGKLANLPLWLVLESKLVDVDGKSMTVQIVRLDFQGTTEQLQEAGYQIALKQSAAKLRIEYVESEARRLLEMPRDVPLPGDVNDDVVEEFYPDQANGHEIGETQDQASGLRKAVDEATQAREDESTPASEANASSQVSEASAAPEHDHMSDEEPPLATLDQIGEYQGLLAQAYGPKASAKNKQKCAELGIESEGDMYQTQILSAIVKLKDALEKKKPAQGGR